VRLYSGTGNVFLLADERFEELPDDPAAVLARQRASGVEPADGLIRLSFGLERARVVFTNVDGSRPEACGNGLQCAAHHVAHTGGPNRLALDTDAGPRRARIDEDGTVEVSMGRAVVGEPRSIELGSDSLELVPVRVGNPHAVLFVADPDAIPIGELGPTIERHPSFPGGTNVELCALDDRGLRVRVWERGVGETRACGSGACAAVLVAHALGRATSPVDVHSSGGVLRVRLEEAEPFVRGSVERRPL